MKVFRNIVCIIGLDVVLFLLLSQGELYFYSLNPPMLEGETNVGVWKAGFHSWALRGVIVALGMSLLWYILAQWAFKVNNPEATKGKRLIWFMFYLLSVIGAIAIGAIFEARFKSGSTISVYLFFVANGILCYHLPTALCSPSSFKYIPWGAALIRR